MIKVGINPEMDKVFFPIISIVLLNVPIFDISIRFVEHNDKKIFCEACVIIMGLYIEYCRCDELEEKGIDVVSCGHKACGQEDDEIGEMEIELEEDEDDEFDKG